MTPRYRDRHEAGEILARQVQALCGALDDVLVLALPRGGVPIGALIAKALDAELDVMIVRKLGMPSEPELAMGAIASGGSQVLNERIAGWVDAKALQHVIDQERAELARREQAYRGDRPAPVMQGRHVVLVDDGLATGATMRAAVAAVRQHEPKQVIVAVPVAPPETADLLGGEVDRVICPETPCDFGGIGRWYASFPQITDEQVRTWLDQARRRAATR